jgi:hypothetical protein
VKTVFQLKNSIPHVFNPTAGARMPQFTVALMPTDYRSFAEAARWFASSPDVELLAGPEAVPHIPLAAFEAQTEDEAIDLFRKSRPYGLEGGEAEIVLSALLLSPSDEGSRVEVGYAVVDAGGVTAIARSIRHDLDGFGYKDLLASDAHVSLPIARMAFSDLPLVERVAAPLFGRRPFEIVLGTRSEDGAMRRALAFKS